MNKPDQTAPKLTRRFKLKPLGVRERLLSALLFALVAFGQPATVARLIAQEAAPLRYFITQSTGSILSGTTDVGNHCDDCLTTIALPFTYELYGQPFTQARAGANGSLQFNSSDAAFLNSCLPNGAFSYTIFPHWDDLWTADTGEGIFTTIFGTAPNRTFVIEWRAGYFNGRSQRANFEIALYENAPRFDIIYGQIDQSGVSATVGVQQGAEFSQFECNAGGLFSGLKLTFAPGGERPTANVDAYLVDEDATLSVDPLSGVLANDTDADGDALSAVLVTLPAQSSSFTFNADGSFTYEPAANFNGTDSFTYKANDGTLDSDVVAVTITVAPVNDRPTFTDAGNVSIAEDFGPAIVPGWASGINAGPVNESGQAVIFQVVGNSNPGLFAVAPAVAPNGNLTFAAAPNANGSSTIAVVAKDNGGIANGGADTSVAHAFTITVTPVNDGPVANAQSLTIAEDTTAYITLSGSDADGDLLTFSIVSAPSHGTLGGTPPNLTYSPTLNYSGADSFTFKVNDAIADSAEATISITVNPVDDAPQLANPGNKIVNELEPLSFTISGTDADASGTLAYSISSGAQPGMNLETATGEFSWTPDESQGPNAYTVTFRVTDGAGLYDEKTITITVNEANSVPLLSDVPTEVSIPELAPFTFNATATDSDAPVQSLTFSLVGAPAGATIEANSGVFSWTPAEDQGPADYSFSVRVSDGVSTADALVILHVTEVNGAPALANPGNRTVDELATLNFTLNATDSDLPANTLSYSIASGAHPGMALDQATGAFSWTPAEAQGPGSYTVTFRVKDNGTPALSDEKTITITVNEVNTAPVANGQSVTTAEDTALAIVLTGSDRDLPVNTLSYTVIGGPAHGTLSGTVPNLTYTPAADYNGGDSFTFKANDGTADSDPASVIITVTPVNDNPVAANDALTVNQGSAGNVINVLANDSIAPDVGETLTVVAVTQGAHGSAAIVAGGTAVTYTPAPDFFGSDAFSYTIADGNGGSAAATVNVTVLNVNHAPVLYAARMSSETVNENDFVTMTGSLWDADPDDAHTVTIGWGDGTANEVIHLPSGQQTFAATHQYLDDKPSSTSRDINTITCTVSDGNGGTASETATVAVKNLAPVITSVTGPTGPLALGSSASVSVNFTDVGTLDTHLVRISWDDGTADTILSTGGFSRSASHIYTAAGVYTVGVSVTDDDTGVAATTYEYIVVYDPSAGFVTGGGWITSPPGAYPADPALSGKASFGFVSKYLKGATTPSGKTQFQFQVAKFDFHSVSYEWLVVSGPLAQFKGSGAVNGAGDYGFLLTATDGQVSGGGGVDKFRIKIWDKTTGAIVYDNAMGESDDINSGHRQAIGGGSIVIQKAKMEDETVTNTSRKPKGRRR